MGYIRLLGLIGLAVLSGCTLAPPKLSVTVGTYTLKQGNQTKTGFALFSSFDPSRSIPQEGFEIRVSGPGVQVSRSYPAGKLSDWFADPDVAVRNGDYTINAKVGNQEYQFRPKLDTSSSLAPPEPQLTPNSKTVSTAWKAVTGAQIYFVTLNKLSTGKPQTLDEKYTTDPTHTFSPNLVAGEIYFVAVGALSLNPKTGHTNLSGIPFNTSYGQTRTFTVDKSGNLVILGEVPPSTQVQVLQETP